MGNLHNPSSQPCLTQFPPPKCFEAFACQIIKDENINEEAFEESAKFFVSNFDNPAPIIEEIGVVIEGFGERTVLYIFTGIFLASTIVIWYIVYKDHLTWKSALLVNVIILTVLILFALLYRVSISDYLNAEFNVVTNSLEKWLDDQIEKLPKVVNDTACIYVVNVPSDS